MLAPRKAKSLGSRSNRSEDRESICCGRRCQSGIPKPPDEAPLFRHDILDRFYSKIPYPTKSGNLFDVLAGEEFRRYGNSSRMTQSSAGFSHSVGRRDTASTQMTMEGRDKVDSVSLGVDPVMTNERSQSTNSSVNAEENPRRSISDTSRLSNKPENVLFLSQLTVCERGSNLEDWESQTYFSVNSVTDSDLSSVRSEGQRSQEERPQLVGLPPSFLKDCMEDGDRQLAISRVSSASEVHSSSAWEKKEPSRTQSPFSMTPADSPFKTGRFRRRPQIPASESSDDDLGDDSRPGSAMSLSSETSKKHSLSQPLSYLITKQPIAMTFSGKSENSLEHFSLCAVKSEASYPDSYTFQLSTPDYFHRHAAKEAISKKAVHEKASRDGPISRRMTRWFGMTVGISVKALLIISGAAMAQFLVDSQKTPINTPQSTEVIEPFDADAQEIIFTYPLVPEGHMTQSYPISLLDSLSEIDSP